MFFSKSLPRVWQIPTESDVHLLPMSRILFTDNACFIQFSRAAVYFRKAQETQALYRRAQFRAKYDNRWGCLHHYTCFKITKMASFSSNTSSSCFYTTSERSVSHFGYLVEGHICLCSSETAGAACHPLCLCPCLVISCWPQPESS